MSSTWADRRVLVTGGASFISSHLVDRLVELDCSVTVVDDLSSGTLENLEQSRDSITFVNRDLEYIARPDLLGLFRDQEYVFHLAAVHGGRGYIATHPADVCSNFSIDHHVLEACASSGVENVVFASSACVYPPGAQAAIGSDKLAESDSEPKRLDEPMSADIEYGWAKLMAEVQLEAFHKQYGLGGCPVRFVSAYGPRENETHSVIALIYKAVERMDPYVIWGDGRQERDFTYVKDIVEGCLLAADRIRDGTPVNLGMGKKYNMIQTARIIFDAVGWHPDRLEFDESKPVGVMSRVLDNSRARELLHWEPRYSLHDGIRETVDWYVRTHRKSGCVSERALMERR